HTPPLHPDLQNCSKHYDDVMGISDGIYEGNDYLPHRYHSWMTEPYRVVILAKRDGKLVRGLCIVGKVSGMRVCSRERGRGLAGVIIRFTDQYILIFPVPGTPFPFPPFIHSCSFALLHHLSVLQAILSLQIEAEAFDAYLSTLRAKLEHETGTGSLEQESRLVVLEEEQLRHILLDPGVSSQIELPGDVIIQDWQPLKLLGAANLPSACTPPLTQSPTGQATLRCCGDGTSHGWLIAWSSQPPFSLHTPPYPIPYRAGSLCLNIDLFGTKPDLAYRALLAHMEMVRGEIQGLVLMHIYMHQSLWGRLRAFCECSVGVSQHAVNLKLGVRASLKGPQTCDCSAKARA
uniref:Histidine N-acetyltransferase C-terminal domain-containing protein n=1 Tax=Paramormyrops kingsleyae TaxID=1676925 RepID=A0A3B3QWB2_9TELE